MFLYISVEPLPLWSEVEIPPQHPKQLSKKTIYFHVNNSDKQDTKSRGSPGEYMDQRMWNKWKHRSN